MFCIRCGRQIADDINFCPHCGMAAQPQVQTVSEPAPVQAAPVQEEKPSIRSGLGLAITLSAISLAFSSVLSLITGVIGIIFAALAKGKCNSGDMQSAKAKVRVAKSMNITSIVLLVLWVIMIVALIVFAVRVTSDVTSLAESGDLIGMSAQELDQFLQEYGYNYDIDALEEYLEYNFGSVVSAW